MWIDNIEPFKDLTEPITIFSYSSMIGGGIGGIGTGQTIKTSFEEDWINAHFFSSHSSYKRGVVSIGNTGSVVFSYNSSDKKINCISTGLNTFSLYLFYSYEDVKILKFKNKDNEILLIQADKTNRNISVTNEVGANIKTYNDASSVDDTYSSDYFCIEIVIVDDNLSTLYINYVAEINIENYLEINSLYLVKNQKYFVDISDWGKGELKNLTETTKNRSVVLSPIQYTDNVGNNYNVAYIPGYKYTVNNQSYNYSGLVDLNTIQGTDEHFWNKDVQYGKVKSSNAKFFNLKRNMPIVVYNNFLDDNPSTSFSMSYENNILKVNNKEYNITENDKVLLFYRPQLVVNFDGFCSGLSSSQDRCDFMSPGANYIQTYLFLNWTINNKTLTINSKSIETYDITDYIKTNSFTEIPKADPLTDVGEKLSANSYFVRISNALFFKTYYDTISLDDFTFNSSRTYSDHKYQESFETRYFRELSSTFLNHKINYSVVFFDNYQQNNIIAGACTVNDKKLIDAIAFSYRNNYNKPSYPDYIVRPTYGFDIKLTPKFTGNPFYFSTSHYTTTRTKTLTTSSNDWYIDATVGFTYIPQNQILNNAIAVVIWKNGKTFENS